MLHAAIEAGATKTAAEHIYRNFVFILVIHDVHRNI